MVLGSVMKMNPPKGSQRWSSRSLSRAREESVMTGHIFFAKSEGQINTIPEPCSARGWLKVKKEGKPFSSGLFAFVAIFSQPKPTNYSKKRAASWHFRAQRVERSSFLTSRRMETGSSAKFSKRNSIAVNWMWSVPESSIARRLLMDMVSRNSLGSQRTRIH